MSIFSYLKQCFVPPREVIAPTEAEQIAIRNILILAKERVWLADAHPNKPEPSMQFDNLLNDETIERSRASINVVEQFMLKYHNLEPATENDDRLLAPIAK